MTRVLVISDSHGAPERIRWLYANERARALVFLGDGLRDLEQAAPAKPKELLVYQVRGNCDFGASDPAMGLCAFGGVLCFYTHGHLYGVKTGYGQLVEAAEARRADLALFGHTHFPLTKYEDMPGRPTLFNPGSLGYDGLYGVLECEDGACRCLHCRLPAGV